MDSFFSPWSGVIVDRLLFPVLTDAKETEARAWLIAHGSSDAEVTAMFAEFEHDGVAWYISDEVGFGQEGMEGATEVWVIALPMSYYLSHPNTIH